MFQTLLRDIRVARDLDDQDVGLVIIRHRDLQTPAVFSLRKWSEITAAKILELLQKLLNSNQSLRLDESFEICIGSIRFPRGGRRVKFLNADDAIDQKRSIVPIRNNDELCMARALAVCFCNKHQVTDEQWVAVVENNPPKRGSLLKLVFDEKKCSKTIYADIRKNSSYQKSLALLILERSHIYHAANRALSIQDIPCIERTLQARIVVISTASGNQIIYKGAVGLPDDSPTYFLLHVKDSHFGAITNIKGFYSRRNFCYSCLKPYEHAEKHVCAFSCAVCGSNACSFAGARECDDCHMLCRSEACFVRHKETKEATQRFPNPQSMCQKIFCCPDCSKIMKVRDRTPEQHVCGEWLCPCCKRYNVGTHLCYQRIPAPAKTNSPSLPSLILKLVRTASWNVRKVTHLPIQTVTSVSRKASHLVLTDQSVPCGESTCGKQTHTTNFVVCQTACHLCMAEVLETSSKCPGCGSRCSKCDMREDKGNFKRPPCSDTCGHREVIFEGDSTAYDFGKWLFSTSHKDFVVLSHNSKAFDNCFLLEYLISQGITPSDVSFAGSKIMSMTVGKGLNIKLLDSLNFMLMALSALPKAFGLAELVKGYFPHHFNTVANQHYRGPYPEAHFYGPDTMRTAAREQFLAWHAQTMKEGAIFDFRKDMLKYCRADVDILRQACLKFRKLILNVTGQEQETGVDPYDYTTIAGVCMGIFKRKFLKEEWKVRLGDPCDDEEAPSEEGDVSESSSNDIVEEMDSDDGWLSAKKMGDEMRVCVDGQWLPKAD
ncbi:uncharacterized protein LOC121377887 [Gigantopelta aegis]|uniref:uncharacterized protein LOC121377887 n=1 Tax=Gigantopelta aegis TaxID=1735272 RepID=UPI001B8876DF|nr:uncharacterized protein LOC121377887 [Gigantopelta aegis]